MNRVIRFFKAVYLKLFRINDTPQKIALGFGLGIFAGVFPGTGPIAALCLAFVFRVNRASALLGSILTNTWISIPVFLLSLKAGALITGVSYQELRRDWSLFVKDFHWQALFDMSVRKIIVPILSGYVLISLAIGAAVYLIALVVLTYAKRKKA